jgi:UDP-sugar transporter A1/2/3
MCLPALIFVIQNNLYYFSLQRIDATLFSMTYQLRILTTALLMMIILDRRFSYLQWFALILTLIGAVTVQLGGHLSSDHKPSNAVNSGVSEQVAGLSAVLVMCMTNAFGGVYLEGVMKKSEDSVFLQNIRLSLISLPMAVVTILSDYETIEQSEFNFIRFR